MAASPQEKLLPLDRNFEPPYGAAEALSPLITRVVARNPGPFTFKGTATFLIGRRDLAIVDPGPDDDDHLQALIKAIAGRPVRHILITHTHLDHSPLASRLKSLTGAPTVGHGRHGTGKAGDDATRADAGADHHFTPDLTIADGEALTGAGWTLKAVFTPGHTSNHVSFALEEEQALFCGDHVMAWSTSVIAPPDGHMGQYLASLAKLLEREDRIYWPSHGPPRPDPHPLVRAYIGHRHMREAAILHKLREGASRLDALVAGIYANVDKTLHEAAGLTLKAHLIHLIEKNLVRAEETAAGAVYRLS